MRYLHLTPSSTSTEEERGGGGEGGTLPTTITSSSNGPPENYSSTKQDRIAVTLQTQLPSRVALPLTVTIICYSI